MGAPDTWKARSAGLIDKWVGGTAPPDMIAAAQACGYDLSGNQSAQGDPAAILWADLVLAMDKSVLEKLILLAGDERARKIQLYLDGQDVPDPMGKRWTPSPPARRSSKPGHLP
ncbi:hypothetical protein ABZT45_44045 [Streptomyces sp. NPDC005356]|uniref:arsenate reductase/protein-tyrosine-phosphatase family protein n=1 Tax=Streptomyces sp. NPDC005356 TaxID=3157167 RepID=UPI0033ABCF71